MSPLYWLAAQVPFVLVLQWLLGAKACRSDSRKASAKAYYEVYGEGDIIDATEADLRLSRK